MANLLLTSNGITSPELANTLVKFISHDPSRTSIAVITNGKADLKSRGAKYHWHYQHLHHYGFTNVHSFNIASSSVESLYDFDAILLAGGDCKLLLSELQGNGADIIIKSYAKNSDKIIVGESAGAIVYGPDLALVDFIESDIADDSSQLTLGLGLYDFYVLPHAHRYQERPSKFNKNLKLFEKQKKRSVFRLEDGEGMIVNL
ncbi:Type 1 glutamine amidotransferase-like domain-containing protein [Tunicatimonas pelagia]|uniref:Type 1 glutamine amidotransferase-like domain-containing protein n=1 Tax=Tunicatimonas pelagia TaxID=931531 RepID=UPI002665B1B8|nr:Type 1 glutamine amidotransferase-like domain-containing protein [Tunicatimonas pelagia]WKN42089.1 Type 1 glutamine amidotransferase-like domain-containing protein [Tunicatimonas pelagia]